jgi:hypothetical protein
MRMFLDGGCILVGLGGIVHQTTIVPPGQANAVLLGTYVTILGIPAGVGLLSLRRNGVSDTTDSPSPSHWPDSRPPPSPSPPPCGRGE